MADELENRCPICLDSWEEEASYVLPCLHQFCYPCVLRWAESKPECPLCKRKILSILHSVRADDDYEEHVIAPSEPPSVSVRQAGGAPRRPDARNLHRPGAPQRRAAEGVPRRPVGGLQTPNWLNAFRSHPTLFQILQPMFLQEQEELFGCRVLEAAVLGDSGTDEELLGRRLGASPQNRTETSPSASQGGSLAPGPAPRASPARSSADELPSTSSAALAGGPGSHPSAPVATPTEPQEPRQEPGEAAPRPSTSSRGRERCPGGTQRPPKRRAGSPEASPDNKRPAPRR